MCTAEKCKVTSTVFLRQLQLNATLHAVPFSCICSSCRMLGRSPQASIMHEALTSLLPAGATSVMLRSSTKLAV